MKRDCDTSVKCGEMVAVTEKIVWKKTYFDFNQGPKTKGKQTIEVKNCGESE